MLDFCLLSGLDGTTAAERRAAAAAQREAAAAQRKAEQDAREAERKAAADRRKAEQDAAAAQRKADQDAREAERDAAAAKKKSDQEAAAAKKKADQEAAAAKKKADQTAAAARKAAEAEAKRLALELAQLQQWVGHGLVTAEVLQSYRDRIACLQGANPGACVGAVVNFNALRQSVIKGDKAKNQQVARDDRAHDVQTRFDVHEAARQAREQIAADKAAALVAANALKAQRPVNRQELLDQLQRIRAAKQIARAGGADLAPEVSIPAGEVPTGNTGGSSGPAYPYYEIPQYPSDYYNPGTPAQQPPPAPAGPAGNMPTYNVDLNAGSGAPEDGFVPEAVPVPGNAGGSAPPPPSSGGPPVYDYTGAESAGPNEYADAAFEAEPPRPRPQPNTGGPPVYDYTGAGGDDDTGAQPAGEGALTLPDTDGDEPFENFNFGGSADGESEA